MKIGILTFHRPANFGANLQAYASTRILSALGHNVKVIDYIRAGDINYIESVGEAQYEAHQLFVSYKLPLTQRANSIDDLKRVLKDESFDAIIVGADAIWRKPDNQDIYWCKWILEDSQLKTIKLASLSPAHMGHGFQDLTIEHREILRHCLEKFSYITVRDAWTKYVINRDLFNGREYVTTVNPDPVIRLSEFMEKEPWVNEGIIANQYYLMTLPKNWCHGSKMDWRKRSWFRKFKKKVNGAGYKLIELPLPEGVSGMQFDYTIQRPIDPIQWFLWIKNAKAFCGLRFHAVVSCISCCTPFFSIDSYGDNSRISLLYDILGLHKFSRKKDVNSKIYQLLKDTGFDNYRTGKYIEFESP